MTSATPHDPPSESDAMSQDSDTGQYQSSPSATGGLPGGIPYIIGNEAAERFSFYGMKSILTIFMTDYLHWMGSVTAGPSAIPQAMSGAEATEHYHTFTAAAYFFPILGALLSDIFLGKYRTILYLSIVYCIGHAALALMGGPGMSAGMWLFAGLLLISIGSGGIKPCVSAHVGDQFGKSNQHLLTKVYQWFYFSINFGSFLSTLLTPYMLQHYGPHWAFGIPGVLMAVATLLFWMGRHKFIHIPAGGMTFVKETFSWTGISAILKLMVIFSFVAVFWALFDQTGSSWVLQAKSLDRNWMGIEWLESQIQAINPILVLTLIPVFQFLIYPAVNQVFTLTPIRKISIGLFVMVGGFAIVSLLQEKIDSGLEPSIAWQFLAYGVLTASEVMVSITCLEFAYTQAPKSMKSVVMAVFLFSVSMGNLFTAAVNNFIQTPSIRSIVAEVPEGGFDASTMIDNGDFVAKAADETTTDGDLVFTIDSPGTAGKAELVVDGQGSLKEIRNASRPIFESAADKIEAAYLAGASDSGESLPSVEAMQSVLGDLQDAHGNPIRYQLISRDRYQLVSEGADKVDGTKWDETLTGELQRAKVDDGTEQSEPTYSWLQRRKIEILGQGDEAKIAEVQKEMNERRDGGAETKFDREYAIGGRTLLEGADYFWFWTKCIAITAILFVPIGYLYREKTYIQDDLDSEKAIADQSASIS